MAVTQWTAKALKQLLRLPGHDQRAVNDGVKGLANWPDCRNVKALVGRGGYRLRVGRYRVLFSVDSGGTPVVVQIEEVRKRDEHTY